MVTGQLSTVGPQQAKSWKMWLLFIGGFVLIGVVVLPPLFTGASKQERSFEVSLVLDRSSKRSLSEICCGAPPSRFQKLEGEMFRTGSRNETLWVKAGPFDEPGYLTIQPPTDHVALVRHDGTGENIRESVSGDMEPTAGRELRSSTYAFEISRADLNKPVFVRIRNNQKYVSRIRFYPGNTLQSYRTRTDMIHGAVMCIIVFMMLYNAILSLLIKDIAFLLNAFLVAGLLVVNLAASGFGVAYIWAGYEEWSNDLLAYATISNGVFGGLFTYVFLTDSPLRRKYRKLLLSIPLFALLIAPFQMLGADDVARYLILAVLAYLLLVMMTVLTIGGFQGDPRARILIVAQGLTVVAGTILFIMYHTLGIELGIPFEHLVDIVLLCEALFFSLALAYRLRLSQAEADKALQLVEVTKRQTGAKVLQSIDDDRRRIAADLHDTAGQGLMVVSNQLASLSSSKDISPDTRLELSHIASYSKHVIGDIRRISHELHPAMMEHLGWESAVRALIDSLGEVSKIDCRVNIDIGDMEIGRDQQLQIYRIVQEAANNIAKHSKARTCRFELVGDGRVLRVAICDDGIGVDSSFLGQPGRVALGLAVMHQRVENLGGDLRIGPNLGLEAAGAEAGRGTCIDIVLPVGGLKV